jgi:hypothetical protein
MTVSLSLFAPVGLCDPTVYVSVNPSFSPLYRSKRKLDKKGISLPLIDGFTCAGAAERCPRHVPRSRILIGGVLDALDIVLAEIAAGSAVERRPSARDERR